MKREQRYLIFKIKDIENYLTTLQLDALQDIVKTINSNRLKAGKEIVKAVVVEHTWPEYELTWLAIEKRVDRSKQI